jgi:hypothetical protein
MIHAIGLVSAGIFAMLSCLHFYWLLGGKWGLAGAIPELDGAPAFHPTALATGVVAFGLSACALLIAALINAWVLPIGTTPTRWAAYGLAALLTLRAIGDFNLLGFFKRRRVGQFARLDTFVYSPLCLGLAASVFAVARWASSAP